MLYRFLKIDTQPSAAVEALLTNNVIGTPGLSMLYQHLGVAEKLYAIPKPHVVSVQRNRKLIGTCVFCEREVDGTTGFYVRYFAFQDGFRLKGIPPHRVQEKGSALRTEIIALLKGKGLVVNPDETFFHYAYVDPRNPRSARLCEEFGFIPVRKYVTRLFSRIWPKAHSHLTIKELQATNEKIRALLTSFYKDYSHVSFENLNKTYSYIENETGEIVAGVQVTFDAWRVITLPGKPGKLLLNIFDRAPVLSRMLAKHFKFLAVEGIYCQTGKEKVFEQLLESLLHRHKLHTAIMVVDSDSSLCQLTGKIKLGLLAKISPDVFGDVIVRGNQVAKDFMERQRRQPAYISVQDVT